MQDAAELTFLSRKCSPGKNAREEEIESQQKQAIGYINRRLYLDIYSNYILACHTLKAPMRDNPDYIVARFVDNKWKI